MPDNIDARARRFLDIAKDQTLSEMEAEKAHQRCTPRSFLVPEEEDAVVSPASSVPEVSALARSLVSVASMSGSPVASTIFSNSASTLVVSNVAVINRSNN